MFVADTDYECPYCKTVTLVDKQRETAAGMQDIKECTNCNRKFPAYTDKRCSNETKT